LNDEIVRAEIEIEIPSDKWLSKLSKKFPNLILTILTMSLIKGNMGNILIRINGLNISPLLSQLESHESIVQFYVVSESENSILLNIKIKNPLMLISTIESEILLKYPVQIQNGWAKWEIYSTREKIHKFFQILKLREINIKLKNIGKHKEKVVLTPRQTEILNIAINEGYYEIPRKISISGLAEKLNISISTLSETLRRINKKLLTFR